MSSCSSPRRVRILVSLCNLAVPAKTGLLLLDGEDVSPVSLERAAADVTTGVGIAKLGARIFHLYQVPHRIFPLFAPPETRLAVFEEKTLELLADLPLPEVLDPHSLHCDDRRLLVVSTGTDEILSYRIDREIPSAPELVWSPSGANSDQHHLNSVAIVNGDLLCSAFGPRKTDKWSSAANGYIYNVTRRRTVVTGLRQPHSLLHRGAVTYYCDSPRSAVCEIGGGVVARAEGYVRGLGFLGSNLLVGSSVGRTGSSAARTVENAADEGELAGRCAVTRYDIKTHRTLGVTDLSAYGTEVYDILSW